VLSERSARSRSAVWFELLMAPRAVRALAPSFETVRSVAVSSRGDRGAPRGSPGRLVSAERRQTHTRRSGTAVPIPSIPSAGDRCAAFDVGQLSTDSAKAYGLVTRAPFGPPQLARARGGWPRSEFPSSNGSPGSDCDPSCLYPDVFSRAEQRASCRWGQHVPGVIGIRLGRATNAAPHCWWPGAGASRSGCTSSVRQGGQE